MFVVVFGVGVELRSLLLLTVVELHQGWLTRRALTFVVLVGVLCCTRVTFSFLVGPRGMHSSQHAQSRPSGNATDASTTDEKKRRRLSAALCSAHTTTTCACVTVRLILLTQILAPCAGLDCRKILRASRGGVGILCWCACVCVRVLVAPSTLIMEAKKRSNTRGKSKTKTPAFVVHVSECGSVGARGIYRPTGKKRNSQPILRNANGFTLSREKLDTIGWIIGKKVGGMHCAHSVSYTHLTLPTNREV